MRRIATQQLRAQRERMEKTCPSVFTLVPARDFQLLDTWFESFTQGKNWLCSIANTTLVGIRPVTAFTASDRIRLGSR